MKIEAYILCYNEERMIRHTLNYYSTFCQKITVFDNNSLDNSIRILEKYYPNVYVEFFNTRGEYREDVLIHIRNNCWKNSTADYVIVCDMDEFLYSDNIQTSLELLKANNVIIPIVYGYNMVSAVFPNNYDIPITDQVKTGVRDRFFDKSIIFSPTLLKEINFGPGSHFCSPVLAIESRIDYHFAFKLLHYKYLSKEHLYQKHKSYNDRMSEINKQRGYGEEYMLGDKYIDDKFANSFNYLYKVI